MFFVMPLLLHLMIFAAEQQGTIDIHVPSYVTQRNAMVPEVSEPEKQGVVVYFKGNVWGAEILTNIFTQRNAMEPEVSEPEKQGLAV